MRKLSLLICLFAYLIIGNAEAQEKAAEQKKETDKVPFTVKANFPVNVSHSYLLTDTTDIEREFSDGTSQKYTRILKYYFSLRAPNLINKEKQLLVVCSVDSLEYTLLSNDSKVFYHSQADDLRPPKHEDYQILMSPLGLEFEMTYSPYQEVANIGGEAYKEKMFLINDPQHAPSDSIIKFTWNDRLSSIPLLTYFDIVKGIYPNGRVIIDSSWNKVITNDVEGATVVDSVKFTLKSFNIKNFIIEGQSYSTKVAENDVARLFNIRQLLNVQSAEGSSNYKVKIHPKGTIEELTVNGNYTVNYQIARDVIKQKVNSRKKWLLLGMYNW